MEDLIITLQTAVKMANHYAFYLKHNLQDYKQGDTKENLDNWKEIVTVVKWEFLAKDYIVNLNFGQGQYEPLYKGFTITKYDPKTDTENEVCRYCY